MSTPSDNGKAAGQRQRREFDGRPPDGRKRAADWSAPDDIIASAYGPGLARDETERIVGGPPETKLSHPSVARATALVRLGFPGAFLLSPKALRPLKVGILADLAAELPQVPAATLKKVLSRHCRRIAYQRAVAAGGERVDLFGHPAGTVDPAHQQAAAARVVAHEAKRQAAGPRKGRPMRKEKFKQQPAPGASGKSGPVVTVRKRRKVPGAG